MNSYNKYFSLLSFLLAGFVSTILAIVLIFYILKLFAITLFFTPGFNTFYQYTITFIPYIIFFAGYFYMNKKRAVSPGKISKIISGFLIILGSLICLACLGISSLQYASINNDWLRLYQDNAHFVWIFQIFMLLIIAGIIATGHPKEKDWMDKLKKEN